MHNLSHFRQNSGGGDYYAAGAALLQVRKQEVFLYSLSIYIGQQDEKV
jgi:hypothetical protein